MPHRATGAAGKWLGLAAGIILFAQGHLFDILPEQLEVIMEVLGAAILAANTALVKSGH